MAAASGQPGAATSAGGSGAISSGQPGSSGGPNLNFTLGQQKNAAPPAGNTSGRGGSRSASKRRGSNWALPDAKPHAIGVTRPLHVAVLADRIVLVPDRGDRRAPVVVPVAPEMSPDDVEHFITAMQKEISGWGLAVADGYWKPVLQVEVAPDAERHFSNLQTALKGSGVDVVRR
jgi:hypothetical protein